MYIENRLDINTTRKYNKRTKRIDEIHCMQYRLYLLGFQNPGTVTVRLCKHDESVSKIRLWEV